MRSGRHFRLQGRRQQQASARPNAGTARSRTYGLADVGEAIVELLASAEPHAATASSRADGLADLGDDVVELFVALALAVAHCQLAMD